MIDFVMNISILYLIIKITYFLLPIHYQCRRKPAGNPRNKEKNIYINYVKHFFYKNEIY